MRIISPPVALKTVRASAGRAVLAGRASAALDWNRPMNAQAVQKIPLKLRAATGMTGWHLVKLQQGKPMLAK
jgi:hypothetical protein